MLCRASSQVYFHSCEGEMDDAPPYFSSFEAFHKNAPDTRIFVPV